MPKETQGPDSPAVQNREITSALEKAVTLDDWLERMPEKYRGRIAVVPVTTVPAGLTSAAMPTETSSGSPSRTKRIADYLYLSGGFCAASAGAITLLKAIFSG